MDKGKIQELAGKYHVDASILQGIHSVAGEGAGLNNRTAASLGADLSDPDSAIEGAAKYMSILLENNDGNYEKSLKQFYSGNEISGGKEEFARRVMEYEAPVVAAPEQSAADTDRNLIGKIIVLIACLACLIGAFMSLMKAFGVHPSDKMEEAAQLLKKIK